MRGLVAAMLVLCLGLSLDSRAGDKKTGDKKSETAGDKAKVTVPDKNLEAALRGALFEAKGNLTEAMLNNISVLEAKGKKIANLSGLEKCKNIALINLANNDVADLTPLKDLKVLQSLDLSGNRISDLTPLRELTRLSYVELSGNQI